MKVRDCIGAEIEVWCPKCQDNVKVIATNYIRGKNGQWVLKGTHVCGAVCTNTITANMEA